MLAGVLGIGGLVLVICVIGAVMEEDMTKALKFGGALAVCGIAILMLTKPLPHSGAMHCYIDWDGRANADVCE